MAALFFDEIIQPRALSPGELAIRAVFVEEYLKDYDGYLAAIRCNFHPTQALQAARELLQDAEVNRMIQSKLCNFHTQGKRSQEQRDLIIRSLIKEAHAHGMGCSQVGRISALSTLAKIFNLDKVQEKASVVHHVMEVPMAMNNDDWESTATKQQAKLKNDAGV